jgi:hypothetical protein
MPECSALKSEMPSTPSNDRFAVDGELLVSVLQRGLDDPGIALQPVIPAARNCHTIVRDHHHPVGVEGASVKTTWK